ncbi:MAG: hypothetical protein ACLFS5_13245 [Spirochaetaceae bacterium]
MLLALVAYARGQVKTVLVGSTFLLVTGATYGAFIAGAFTVFAFLPYLDWIRSLTAVVASFAVLSVMEYFDRGTAVRLSLSPDRKRGIARLLRTVIRGNRGNAALVGLTAAAAAEIALVVALAFMPQAVTSIGPVAGVSCGRVRRRACHSCSAETARRGRVVRGAAGRRGGRAG